MKEFNPTTIHLYHLPPTSHKGQNGKLLVIGGSKLFHSSVFWSADIASRIIDIVHFTSPANENNDLVRRKIKQKFWNGIVVDWGDVEKYIEEDDAILIGPGMIRDSDKEGKEEIEGSEGLGKLGNFGRLGNVLEKAAEDDRTSIIVNSLLRKYPTKKWVIDGGGLQEVDPRLITESCILTPHKKEFLNLADKCYKNYKGHNFKGLSEKLHGCTILLKGPIDTIYQADRCTEISGGNPGMTKGGTGDVLAGLVAALYCKNDAWTAATVGSFVNKKAGDQLYEKVGPYFNATDLVNEIPQTMKHLREYNSREQKALQKL